MLWAAAALVVFGAALPGLGVVLLNATTPSAERILRDRGLPVTPEEWEAWHFDQPGSPNAAPLYLEAAALRESDPNAAFDLLLEAAEYHYCRFPLDMVMTTAAGRGFRRDARELSVILFERMDESLERDDREGFMNAIEAACALAHAISQQPESLEFTTTIALLRYPALTLLPAALEASLLNEYDLDRIGRRLDAIDITECARRAIVGSMALYIREVDGGFAVSGASSLLDRAVAVTSLPARIQAVFARDFLRVYDLVERPYAEQRSAVDEWEYSSDGVIDFFERVSRSPYRLATIADPAHFVSPMAMIQGIAAVTKAGLAVERYRLTHERLPESVEEITAAGMVLPDDPLGTGPIRYAVDNGGYRTWSVGLDGVDDGGREVHSGQPDIVFRVDRRVK